MKAIIEIHNVDLAEKYLEQNIEIFMLGTPHYILPSDLLYNNMRLFRRMNATIKMGPVFCEEEYLKGCVFGFRNEKLDLIIKTDSFHFEIYRHLTIFNLNIFANDIILTPASIKSCYNNSLICCDKSLFQLNYSNDECGLLQRGISLNEKSKLTTLSSLFKLRMFYDVDFNKSIDLRLTPIPFLNISNVLFQNFHSIKGDSSWLSLIMLSTLGYNITLNNTIFKSIFFPYGILISISLEDDPYYNYLTTIDVNKLYEKYPNSNEYNNNLIIYSCVISDYNLYDFKIETNYAGIFAIGLVNFFNEQNKNPTFELSQISLINLSLPSDIYFFSYVSPARISNLPLIHFKNIVFQNNSLLSFINAEITNIVISSTLFDNCIFSSTPLINLYTSGFIYIFGSTFSNSIMTDNGNILTANNHIITFNNSLITNMADNFAYIELGILNFINCTLFNIHLPTSLNMISFSDSSFGSNNLAILNSTLKSPQNTFFYFYATTNISIIVLNLKMKFTASYIVFFLECYDLIANIYFENVFLNQTGGIKNSKWFHNFFVDCTVGSFNNMTIKNFETIDVRNLEITIISEDFNSLNIINFHVKNLLYLNYYCFSVSTTAINYLDLTNNVLFENVTFKDIQLNRSISLGFFSMFGKMRFINCSFSNITYQESVLKTLTRNELFYLNSMNFLFIENSYFDVYENTFLVSILLIYGIDNNIVQNNTFQGKYDKFSNRVRVRAVSAIIFVNFTFLKNKVLNMSSLVVPLDITDETGVISFLGSGSYSQPTSVLTVIIIGNYFFGNLGVKYGVLGIVGSSKAIIINNTFIASESYYGGAIALIFVSNVYVEYLSTDRTMAVEGGAIYIYAIKKEIIIKNSNFYNLIASNGGVVYLIFTSNFVVESLNIENITSTQKAGAFFISNCYNTTFLQINSVNTSATNAGWIFIESSSVSISKLNCFGSQSTQIGGALYIIGLTSIVFIQNTTFSSCSSGSDGAILSSLNIRNLTIISSSFLSSFTKASGNGIINLVGFSIFKIGQNKIYGVFDLKNISCMDNIALLGGCLYYSSNNNLILRNFIISNISGSILNVESDSTIMFIFENFLIRKSNYFSFEENFLGIELTNPLIVFINLNFMMIDFDVDNNTAKSNLMKISSSKATIKTSKFCNFFNNFGQNPNFQRFFFISDSEVVIQKTEFSYTNKSLIQCMFLEIRSSIINISETLFHDSKTNDLACIILDDSFINFESVEFFNLGGSLGILSFKTTNVYIEGCLFHNNLNILLSSSDNQASNIIFDNDEIYNQNITITESVFYNSAKNVLVINMAFIVTISNCKFYSVNVSSFSRAIYFVENSQVNIISSIFENFRAEIGAALSIYQIGNDNLIMKFSILNCTFFNNTAYFGGSIYSRGSIYIIIISSIFLQNSAKISSSYTKKVIQRDTGKGGCVLNDCEYYSQYRMELKNSFFINNSADNFGPTIVAKSLGKNQTLIFSNNSFENNSDGLNYTNMFSSSPIKAYLLSKDFKPENYYDLNLSTNNEKIQKILSDYNINSTTIASGQEFNFSIILTDAYDQLLLFESNTVAELTCSFYNNTLSNDDSNSSNNSKSLNQNIQTVFVDKGTSQSINGILTFSGTKIVMTPHSNLSCNATITLDDSVFFQSTLEMGMNGTINRNLEIYWNIYVRNCIKGELLMDDNTCFKCLTGTYLLEDPMIGSYASKKCNNCPNNAYCKGGKYISPYAGFWRYSENSTLILECPTPEGCEGIGIAFQNMMNLSNLTEKELTMGICNPKYRGNLCYTCSKGYGRVGSNQNCEECSSLILIYIKMSLSLIFIVGYIAIQAKIFSNIDKKDPNLAIMMKLILNHFQTISMINLVSLGWTIEFSFYFSAVDYLSFLSQDFFIIDCLVQNIDQNLLVQKIIFTVLLPIILSLLMISIWMITFFILLYRKKGASTENSKFLIFISEKMRITLLILVFILYPEILRKSFSLLNCLLIDDSDDFTVLTASPNVQCWNGDHKTWVLTVSMPGLIVWGVFTPLIIFLVLYKYKSKIQNFIQVTRKQLKKKNTSKFNIKKKKIIEKRIYLDIQSDLVDKIFLQKIDSPINNSIEYEKNNQIFTETIIIQIKNKNLIIEEMKSPIKETPEDVKVLSMENELELTNNEKIIDDPAIIFELLNFLDYLNTKILVKDDLTNNLIRMREEFSIFEKKKKKNDNNLDMQEKSEINAIKTKKIIPKVFVVIQNLGFIYRGYRPEFYFWETIMFTRKFFLIFIGVFTEFFPKKTKPIMLIIILVGYIYLQIKFKPYQFEYLNKLEACSLIVVFLTANIGILLFSEFMQKFSAFFLFLIFALNFLYVSIWLKYLVSYGNLKERFQEFLRTLNLIKRRLIKSLFG